MTLKEFCILAIDNADAVFANTDSDANNDRFSSNYAALHKASISRVFDEYDKKRSLMNDIMMSYAKSTNINISIKDIYEIDDDHVIVSYNDIFVTYVKSKNKVIAECSNTLHEQILVTLGNKYLGSNQHFSEFASKMLELDSSK